MVCRPTTIATKYADGLFNQDATRFTNGIYDFADIINQQNNPVDNYDKTALNEFTRNLNRNLRRVDLSGYPLLDSKLKQVSNLTSVEVADFLNQSGYDFDSATGIVNGANSVSSSYPRLYTDANNIGDLANLNPDNNVGNYGPIIPWAVMPTDFESMVDQLEFYNNENVANTISGGFCSAFQNPFNQVLKIIGAIQLGVKLLDKLKSFSLADLFDAALGAALDAIKDKLASIVDKIKATVMQQIKNITQTIGGIVNSHIAIFDEITKRAEDVKSFFNDSSMETIKDGIRKFVDDAKKQFEELTPEAILLLLFRFCQFAEMIQGFLKSPVDALRNHVNNIKLQIRTVTSMGLINTKLAVDAGAQRFTQEAREDARKRMMDTLRARADSSPNVSNPGPAPDPEVYVNNPNITEEEARELGTLSNDGIPGKIKWAPSVLNMGKSVSDAEDDAGWKMINNEVKLRLLRTATRFGRELTINSGYRSPEYNRRIGGAKRSQHMSGYAIDVSMAGLSSDDIRRFIRIASQEGFMGMSYYPGSNFTHVDIGGRRTWGSNGAYASWVNAHVKDEFRNGARGRSEQQQNA
jgi:hypothetical protein